MTDAESATRILEALKALGLQIAVDDFGTGYSSLAYLKRFPVDIVKIDRSFVAGLGTDPDDTSIVAAVVKLTHALGRRVVAEGVETREQLAALVALECDRAQGYYLGRPAPAAELEGSNRLAS
jgi:diguanylate cyclase